MISRGRMNKKILAGLILGLTAQSLPALMRCDGWIIKPGQSLFEIQQKCGEPQAVERRAEWRTQTTFQQQCQTIQEPIYQSTPTGSNGGQVQTVTYMPRTVCNSVPVTFTVPVEVESWYFDDPSVPKALHFENGRLNWIEDLWKLRHPN